jgi:class 3 adenylate cyclase
MDVETRYALSGNVHIAYHVAGAGDVDLMFVPAFMSNIELSWDQPGMGAFLRRLASFTRLIQFDRRGTGSSDGGGAPVPLEDQVDDVRAVLDATGASNPALIAVAEGSALAMLFAASHPELVRALVLLTPQARMTRAPGYEWALSRDERDELVGRRIAHWGSSSPENPWMLFIGNDAEARRLGARHQRLSMGPGDAAAMMAQTGETDVRGVLGSIQCPTLVLRRENDEAIDERHVRYVAEHVPASRYVQLPGEGQLWLSDSDDAAREIEAFLTGAPKPSGHERTLATVLFTDIVGSTEHAHELGDERWRRLLERHDQLVRAEVAHHRGRLVKSLGDGALALFDGPSRAIAAALAIRDGVRTFGLQVRAGLHTGECELLGEDVGGVAVHIGARIAALADPNEVLVSGTVRDLTVGSPYRLDARGERRLRGISEPWRVFAVAA